MTSYHILNIGLSTGGASIADSTVFKAMRAAGILWERYTQRESDTEPTLVVEAYCNDHQVDLVSQWLEQDCIAVWDLMHREGRLVGPRAADWGEFDPDQFIMPDGALLGQERSVA